MNSVTFGLACGQKVRTRYSGHELTVVGNYISRDGVKFAEVEFRRQSSDPFLETQFVRESELTSVDAPTPAIAAAA